MTQDKCVTVFVQTPYISDKTLTDYINELNFLITTLGAVAVKSFSQRLPQADSRTYVGSGKLLEIKDYIM